MPSVISVPSILLSSDASAAAEYEDAHVHAIYEQIAPHFSSTRYKPWPVIAAFLETLPSGWIGVDSGTGNGKYLPLGPARSPNSVLTIGLDKSLNLLKIAQNAGGGVVRREVIRANVLDACWRQGIFDYSISIATVHHLATYERRKQAVQRLLQTVSPSHGRLLIYVWAVDQDEFSKREIPPDKHTGTAVTANRRQDGADVFVPWVFAPSALKTDKSTYQYNPQAETNENATNEHRVFNRYYHMFAKGELRRLVENAAEEMGLVISGTGPEKNTMAKVKRGQRGIEFVQDGWERSNYYVEVRRWTASELVETS
ncbi:hypothetical protein D9757_001977 [Collybiopsis confluens]|uniref:Methyltransferase type 11 domain-containing protein n=1 Tax=Collybiopsis confluens TaxID=2823264 RepID=A0A8H5MF38_9AGAR|nr:hypothetical protein D9757_001977 [Collybiopsis confluens]